MSNMFYTTCGKKFNLENFGDIPISTQSTTKTLAIYLLYLFLFYLIIFY